MLHRDEIPIDEALVRRLLGEQFGAWARLPLAQVTPPGTVNAMFRLGQDLCVRLPRLPRYEVGLRQELTWLPKIAPLVTLAVPTPVAVGRPSAHFPLTWAVYRWIDGTESDRKQLGDQEQTAVRLAQFILQMRRLDTGGAPRSTRDRPLPSRDSESRQAIAALPAGMDRQAISAAWEVALAAPGWSGVPVWTHGDLLPPNLVLRDGRLAGVIDFGQMGAGDPAVDLIPAWTVLGKLGRQRFRAALDVDAGLWARSRGFALHQALLIIPYYLKTNPSFAAMARRTIDEILADLDLTPSLHPG